MVKPIQLHQIQQGMDFFLDLVFARAQFARFDPKPKRNIVEYGHMPEQCIMLEHKTDAPVADMFIGHVFTVQQHPALVRLFKPRNDT